MTKIIARTHVERGEKKLNSNIIEEYLKNYETRCLNGEISEHYLKTRRNMTDYTKQIYHTGTILCKAYECPSAPTESFEQILSNLRKIPPLSSGDNNVLRCVFYPISHRQHLHVYIACRFWLRGF